MEKSLAKRLPKYVKQSPVSDPQQNLVYFMEGDALGAIRDKARMTRKDIRALVRSVCKTYGMPRAKVCFRPLKKWTAMWEEPYTLVFNTRAVLSHGLLVVLHELSHMLHYVIQPELKDEGHGPEFMCCYMDILDTTRTIPLAGMRAICDIYGIKYADRGKNNSLAALTKAVLNYSA